MITFDNFGNYALLNRNGPGQNLIRQDQTRIREAKIV